MASGPRPSFRALAGTDDRGLADRYRAATRAGDHATAWLIADRLVRTTAATDPTPLVMRASSLARLGFPDLARADLKRAADRDPFDALTNTAIAAAGDRDEALKALLRMRQAADGVPRRWLLDRLAQLGRAVLVSGQAEASGVVLEGVAAAATTVPLVCRGETVEEAVALVVAEPAAGGDGLLTGRIALPWPAEEVGLAVAGPADVLIDPTTLLRPPQPERQPQRVLDPGTPRSLMLLVPVYDDYQATRACLQSVLDTWPRDRAVRLVIVDDVTPDPRIAAMLDQLSAAAQVDLIRNRINLGFAGGVNRALAGRRPGEDVLLLNADTLVPPGAVARLHDIVLADPAIGTATPLSNNGEDTSLPVRFTSNPLPPAGEVARLNDLAWRSNGAETIVMPNGVGFCMMIAAPLLERMPHLPTAFGRGYYEDVAYGLEARALGFDNVCATGIYVGHAGSRSFRDDKRALVRRNLDRLRQHHPGYAAEADAFFARDPLKPAIARLEKAWLSRTEFALVVATDHETAERFIRHVVPDSAPAVALSAAAGGVVLRGCRGSLPQSLDLVPDGAEAVGQLLARASAVIVVDPHGLPPPLAVLLPLLPTGATAVLSAAPDEQSASWRDGFARVLATSRIVAAAWQSKGVAAAVLPSEDLAAPALTAGGQCLHVLAGPEGGEGLALAAALLQRAGATGGPEIVLVADGSSPPGVGGVAWPGPIARSDFPAWAAMAGPAPILLASRRHGCGDERLDGWLAADVPVAFFDPGAVLAVEAGRSLRLPVDLGDAAAANRILDWLASLPDRSD